MTTDRLAIIAALCMALSAAGVYMLTSPPAAQSASPEPPPPPTSVALASTSTPRTVSTPRSDPPTAREWSNTPVSDLKGAVGLNCSAKVLRDWLRIACEPPNSTGGVPKDLRIQGAKVERSEVGSTGIPHFAWRTNSGVAYTAASSTIISLVCPFVEGVNIEALFQWTDKKAMLIVAWPAGAPEPRIKGRFKLL